MTAALAGCGGGGGAAAPVPGPSGGGRGTAALTLRIDVPLTGTASQRRPAYVSPSTQSLAIAVFAPGQSLTTPPLAAFSVNVTPSSPSCQTVASALTCSIQVPLTLPAGGTYTLATATYDHTQAQSCAPNGTPACAGNVLSAALTTAALQVNATNVVSMVLGGLANGFTVTPAANGFFKGSVAGLSLWGSQAQSLVVSALDADGNTIVGAGAPTIALSTASPNVAITTSTPGQFALQATMSGGPPTTVTPGTINLTAVATPVGSPAGAFTQTIPLTIAHTAVFVSSVPSGNALVFLDGNTTQSLMLATTNQARGVTVDVNGNVYVANHGNNTISECTAASNYATCTVPISVGLNGPEGLAIDGAGNLWEGDSVGGNINEFAAGTLTQVLAIPSGFGTLRGVAIDTNGNLWASDQGSGHVEGFPPPLTALSTPTVTLTSGIATPIQLAADGSGNLWVTSAGANTALQFTPPIASGDMPAVTLSNAVINNDQGVAVDATGVVWIASNGLGGSVSRCPPPAGTVACTSFVVAGALWIAAYPAAFNP
ncbi:MAG TPA: hypothetical protein VGP41_11195 [Candidatus Lustribacter sp.]|nr:hypothetical protein [Candidatus Lustribacter sp.]